MADFFFFLFSFFFEGNMIGELQGVFRPVAFSLTLCLSVSLFLWFDAFNMIGKNECDIWFFIILESSLVFVIVPFIYLKVITGYFDF